MSQAITTKYLGPTNFRGARVKATSQAGSLTLPWDDAKGIDDNHYAAALALAMKFDWVRQYDLDKGTIHIVGGGMPDGRGNVYIIAEYY